MPSIIVKYGDLKSIHNMRRVAQLVEHVIMESCQRLVLQFYNCFRVAGVAGSSPVSPHSIWVGSSVWIEHVIYLFRFFTVTAIFF